MPTKSSEAPKRPEDWLMHLRACAESGQTMADYARAHGLNKKQFYNARTRLRHRGLLPREPTAPRFQRVHIADAPARSILCRMHFPNGLVLEMESQDDATLTRLLHAAKALA